MKRGINVHIVEKDSLESQIFKSISIQYIWMPGNILVDMDVASYTRIFQIGTPTKIRSMVAYILGQTILELLIMGNYANAVFCSMH